MVMKLRVRAASGGATLRVEVPNPGTVYDLRNVISQRLGVPADTIRLSLNKRDEIEGNAGIPLSAFGIRSGDLLYYMNEVVPCSGLAASPISTEQEHRASSSGSSTVDIGSSELSRRRELCAMAADRRANNHASSSSSVKEVAKVDNQQGGGANCEVDDFEVSTLSQIPSLFSRILSMERQNAGRLQDFLVLAVHAVMLETGFVVVGCADNRIAWNCLGSLKYTLPELSNQSVHVVLVACQVVGDFVVVYGSVSGCEQFHRLGLSVKKFLNEAGVRDPGDGALGIYKDTFALWKELKDNLTLRLLTSLSEIAGLPLPASFQILPTELKMKILEFVSSIELGIVSCVSSELRFLASSEDLWRIQYLKEFNLRDGQPAPSSWKQAFIRELYARRRTERARILPRRDFVVPHFRRPPLPHHPWGIIGGDHDIYPNVPFGPPQGGIHPFGGSRRFRRPLNPGNTGPLGASLGLDSPDDSSGGLFRLPSLPGEDT